MLSFIDDKLYKALYNDKQTMQRPTEGPSAQLIRSNGIFGI